MTTLLTSLTRNPNGGGDLTPFPIIPPNGGAAAAWPASSTGIFVKFRVNKPRLASGLRVGIGSASGNAKVALYTSDGTTATQVATSGSTATAGSNAQQDILFGTAKIVVPFQDYYAFLVCDNTTVTIFRTTYGSGGFTLPTAFDVSFAVASVFTTPPATQALSGATTAASGYTPILALI